MQRKRLALCLGLISAVLYGCGGDRPFQPTLDQGIWGRVEFREGNFEPPARGKNNKISYIQTRVFAFVKTHHNDVVVDTALGYTFYSEIRTQLVSRTSSDGQGYFQLELPSGTYSLFVWEQERYYANSFDGFGYIMPVDVSEGAVVRRDMIIDYKAAY